MYKLSSIKSPRDDRDLTVSKLIKIKELPSNYFHPKIKIKDQKDIGTCVGFASSSMIDKEKYNETKKEIETSPTFIYTECKKRDGIPDTEGTYPRVAMKVLKDLGVCLESTLPFDNEKIKKNGLPTITSKMYEEAKQNKISVYAKIETLNEMKYVLTQKPILASAIVTDTFMYPDKEGFIDLPNGKIYGGHAFLIDGYDDNLIHTYENGKTLKGFFRVQNSWGKKWGKEGYAWLPYEFLTFKLDIGASFFDEAWCTLDLSNIDVNIEEIEVLKKKQLILWIGQTKGLLNNKDITLDQAPTINIKTGRTLIPLRQVCEIFGQYVEWNQEDRSIKVGSNIKLWIDKQEAIVNGKKMSLDQPPYIDSKTGRTLIPLRFISEYLGYQVDYIKEDKKIIITEK